jgi:hypothetical protein
MWFKPTVETASHPLPDAVLKTLCEQVSASPYLKQNVLNQRFSTTQGFSLLFHNARDLPEQFSFFKPFLALLNPRYNYYYLNVLQLEKSAQVDRHIDHSIRGYHQKLPFPRRVSILYLQANDLEGGSLQIYNHRDQISHTINPLTGTWVSFKGNLKHGITPLKHSQGPRLSLVCEQYKLSKAELTYVPGFTLKSTATFDTFLSEALPDPESNAL